VFGSFKLPWFKRYLKKNVANDITQLYCLVTLNQPSFPYQQSIPITTATVDIGLPSTKAISTFICTFFKYLRT